MAEPADPAALRRPLVLDRPLRIHCANIAGAGISAVATVLAEMGHRVSGHDRADTPYLARLRELGVAVSIGPPHPPLPDGVELVVTSTATPADDPDVVAAAAAGIDVAHRSAVLGALSRLRRTVAVAGTHGKTTTSALLATVLSGLGDRPGYVVGAPVRGLGAAAAWGDPGGLLVVEADESDGSFLALTASAAVVTNVEPDHLDRWGDPAALSAAFAAFAAACSGPVVLCADDPGASSLAAALAGSGRVVTYGEHPDADYRIHDVSPEGDGVGFVLGHGRQRHRVVVPWAPGRHNAANATAALAVAHQLGHPLAPAVGALGSFTGVARRFEHRGEVAGVSFVDDYAHLPTEVAAALAAARDQGRARVVCVFQPHRFSRTLALAAGFAHSFVDADLVCITDVYGAGEPPVEGVTGKLVADAVLDAHPRTTLAWLPGLDDVVDYLARTLRPGDLCLTLGAGDLTTVADRVLVRLGSGP